MRHGLDSTCGDNPCEAQTTFRFAASKNKTTFTVGGIVVPAKKGWEYMWVMYADRDDDTAKRIVKLPIGVYIEQVYELADFAGLGIGT